MTDNKTINIPAYCDNCEQFVPGRISATYAENITFYDVGTLCRSCGNTASYIDGSYSVINGVIEIFESPDVTAKELTKLTHILQQAIERNTPAGRIKEIIEKEVPRFSGITAFLKSDFGLIPILALIVSIIGLYNSYQKPEHVTPEKILNEIQKSTPSPSKPSKSKPIKKFKTKPNDSCSCKSGKKYKKCCGSKAK